MKQKESVSFWDWSFCSRQDCSFYQFSRGSLCKILTPHLYLILITDLLDVESPGNIYQEVFLERINFYFVFLC